MSRIMLDRGTYRERQERNLESSSKPNLDPPIGKRNRLATKTGNEI